MPLLKPDPTFYPSPTLATQSPPEKLAYLALISPGTHRQSDAIGVVDVDPSSKSYGRLVGQTDMPHAGDELHHFGWNACSSCLCPYAPHPHMERRYLIVPGINSSRIHILDTKPNPRQPKIVKVIEPETLARRTGYATPHTVHCGPDGIYMTALGAPDGNGPGGTFTLDPETFDVRGRWELDRGPQELAYDMWWHLGLDTMVTSTWGTPNMVKDGVNPELLLGGKYGNSLHVWDLRRRRHVQELSLGPEQQMTLELRPAHDPTRAYGFASVVLSLKDLSSSIWLWYREPAANGSSGTWAVKKVIEIPAEPADPEKLPPLLQGFKAVAPLVTDINLSVDDRYLYVSCWGTGEFIQFDVSDPFKPKKISSIRLGGIVGRTAHPRNAEQPLNGGPQMVEVSRDGRRIYFTNSLYTPWDEQFYPDGIRGWMAKVDVKPEGGMELDPRFFLQFDGMRPHQVRLQGGDASSDSVLLRLKERGIVMEWDAVVALGAFHGINPGMGWLFAVALGMQQRSARGVWRALPPIALGHAMAVGLVVVAAALAGLIVPPKTMRVVVAATLMTLGLYRLWRHRHPRYAGMQVTFGTLTVWSFLMASAHGAGFMVLPFVMPMPVAVSAGANGHAGHLAATSVPWTNATAVGVHTLAYLLVMTLLAWTVYRKLGLRLLRTAWFNLDWLWAGALVVTGAVVLLT